MRYAIYFAPPATSRLWQEGCRWLGRDAVSGQTISQPRIRGVDPELIREMTRTPSHYGFHATLVPPFRLQAGVGEKDLMEALHDFSAGQDPLYLPGLTISQLDSFFCLRPDRHMPALQILNSRCIRAFDTFRAPLNPSELARRKAFMLTGQEKRNLELWGYPYVFEQFRFHFTLTGRMGEGRDKEHIHAALIETFGALLTQPLVIDALCLFIEPAFGQPMRCLRRFAFRQPSTTPEERINHDQLLSQDLHPGYQCNPA